MSTTETTRTVTGGGAVKICKRRGWRGLNPRPVIVASDNQNVHEWLYRYLEPYAVRGYAFYQADNEAEFLNLVWDEKPALVFIEDCFFGERVIGRLERLRKQYPKLPAALFSVSVAPPGMAVRSLCRSRCSYLSLRDSDREIRELLEVVFSKGLAVSSSIRDDVDEYRCLPDREPYLTHREIEVVRCIAEGKTQEKTASCLMVSKKTVTNHLFNVYLKFGIRNKVGVLKLAVSKGILPVGELMTYTVQS